MFRSQGLRHLLVVNNSLQVTGILTRKDFQKAGHMHEDGHDHDDGQVGDTHAPTQHAQQVAWKQPEAQA